MCLRNRNDWKIESRDLSCVAMPMHDNQVERKQQWDNQDYDASTVTYWSHITIHMNWTWHLSLAMESNAQNGGMENIGAIARQRTKESNAIRMNMTTDRAVLVKSQLHSHQTVKIWILFSLYITWRINWFIDIFIDQHRDFQYIRINIDWRLTSTATWHAPPR